MASTGIVRAVGNSLKSKLHICQQFPSLPRAGALAGINSNLDTLSGQMRAHSSDSHKASSGHGASHVVGVDRSAYDEWQQFEATKPARKKLDTAQEVLEEVMHSRSWFRETLLAELIDLFRPKSRRRFPRS